MAWLLVQLKLRLLRNALRSSTAAKVSFILSTIFACLFAVGTFAVLAALRGQSASVDLTTVIFTVFAFGWLILPILVFGLDSTLDPASLALYPLRTRPLAVGLLAASATGAWPLANLLGLLGVTVGLASGGFGLLVALLAVLLEVLFCITLARFVTTALAGLLRSRRGKDLAAFLVLPIFALYEAFTQVVPRLAAEGRLTAASFAGVDAWMRWIPPGLAAHAIQDASNGRPGAALLRLALLAAVIVVLGWLWIRSLGRALVTADTSTQSSAVRGGALPFGRYGLRGTVAARFWIYQRREPGSLIYWGFTAVVMMAVSVSTILAPAYPGVLLGERGLRGRLHRRLPRQLGRDHRAGLRLRGAGADRPPRDACLLLRPEHRARHDRGAAAHSDLLRPGGRGRASGIRIPGHGGGSRRDRRGPGPEQHLHGHSALSDGQAGRQSHAQGRRGIHGPSGSPAPSAPSSARRWRPARWWSAPCSHARIRRWSGCRCSCYAPRRMASRWPGSACGSPPARPSRGCLSSARSPSAASCSRGGLAHGVVLVGQERRGGLSAVWRAWLRGHAGAVNAMCPSA